MTGHHLTARHHGHCFNERWIDESTVGGARGSAYERLVAHTRRPANDGVVLTTRCTATRAATAVTRRAGAGVIAIKRFTAVGIDAAFKLGTATAVVAARAAFSAVVGAFRGTRTRKVTSIRTIGRECVALLCCLLIGTLRARAHYTARPAQLGARAVCLKRAGARAQLRKVVCASASRTAHTTRVGGARAAAGERWRRVQTRALARGQIVVALAVAMATRSDIHGSGAYIDIADIAQTVAIKHFRGDGGERPVSVVVCSERERVLDSGHAGAVAHDAGRHRRTCVRTV